MCQTPQSTREYKNSFPLKNTAEKCFEECKWCVIYTCDCPVVTSTILKHKVHSEFEVKQTFDRYEEKEMTLLQKSLPKLTSYIHTLMVVAVMQGADEHIRSSFGPKVTLICRPVDSNSRPSANKTLALPQQQGHAEQLIRQTH